MGRELRAIDIDDMPELRRVAEEVDATGEGAVLRFHNRELAVMLPAATQKPRRRRPGKKHISDEDIAAFRSAAGSWKDVDIEKFKAYIYEGRQSSKPPIEL